MDQSEEYQISDPNMNTSFLPQSQGKPASSDIKGETRAKLFDSDAKLPRKFFFITMLAIFIAEVLAMIVIYNIDSLPYWQETLLDAFIMVVFIFPVVYFLLFRPLLLQIGERKQSEALLSQVLETLPVGVWIMDQHGRVIRENLESQQIWAGTHAGNIIHSDEHKGWWAESGSPIQPQEWASARAVTRRETSLNEEITIETLDGDRKTILNSALPIVDEQNLLLGAVVVNQDITSRRQMERDLIQTNELLERFFLSINTMIAYMDRNFNFIRVNENFAREGGHPPDFFINRNFFELYPDEDNLAIFQLVANTGNPFSAAEKPFEYPEFPEKGKKYFDWSLQPVKRKDGTVEGLVLSQVDVTERKRAEEKLEHQNQELRALSQAEIRQRELAESLVRASIAVNTSLELEQVLYSILEQIRKAIPFKGANIMLVEDQSLHLASSLGFEVIPNNIPPIGSVYAIDEYPMLQQVCVSRQPVNINTHSREFIGQVITDMAWVKAYLAVPLLLGGEVIGIINLFSELPDAFRQDAVEQLLAFAAPAALALHNANRFQAESTARQVAETLSAAAQALGQTLDLEQVVDTLLHHIQMIVNFDTAGITLLDDETHLAIRTLRGFGEWENVEDIPSFPINGITDSVIHRMISARKSIAVPNISTDSSQIEIANWLLVPIIATDKVIGLLELGRTQTAKFDAEQIRWAEALVGQAAVSIQNAWLFQQVQSSSDRLQFLARKLVEIQENERAHIARELHDEAGQVLSSLKLSLGRLEQDPDCPPQFHQQLQDLKSTTDGVLEELHRLAMDLRPAALDHLGLIPALEQYVKKLPTNQLSIQIKSLGFGTDTLSQDVKTSIYRIVQEALTNIVRHSQASSVGILLERIDNRIKVFVEDDGIGFDPELLETPDHLGLVGIRERAEMLGGSLTVESLPGFGTSIIVEVPDGNPDFDRG
jgi:PAS domain S-box-containing protein